MAFRFEILTKIVQSMINQRAITLDYKVYGKIFLDLKTLYSVIYRYMLQPDRDYDEIRSVNIDDCVDLLMSNLRKFILETVANSNIDLVIMYSFLEDKERTLIYNDWERKRNHRLTLAGGITRSIQTRIISKLERLSNERDDTILINYAELPADVIIDRYLSKASNKSKVLLLTRNTVWFSLLRHDNVDIYNSVDLWHGGKAYRTSVSDKYPKISTFWLPLYFTIRGDKNRNNYGGVEKYGMKKTVSYLMKNKDEILSYIKKEDYSFLKRDFDIPSLYICLFDQKLLYKQVKGTVKKMIDKKEGECI